MKRNRRNAIAVPAAMMIACVLTVCSPVRAHYFVSPLDRVAASPDAPGSGWRAEVFLGIPNNWAGSLLSAETYVADKSPDFTFRTAYVDFPAGPDDSLLDAEVASIGDFLGDGIIDVSDPAMLDQPMGNFLMRFSALVNVRFEPSSLPIGTLPVLLDFGTQGYGGYRVRLGRTSVYRIQNHVFNGNNPFFTESAFVEALGLYPITVTYYNRYDPTGENGHERVGVELYSFHEGGLPWPAGQSHISPVYGYMTLAPPFEFYQPGEEPALARGDFDADGSITLADFAASQRCRSGAGVAATDDCRVMDFDNDGDVDSADEAWLVRLLAGPNVHPVLPGDYDANNRLDLADYAWFQWCVTAGGGDERAGLPLGCGVFDFDGNTQVNSADLRTFQPLLFGPMLPTSQ